MILLRLLGGVFVTLGAIGLFLPVWPTTIFWIIAAVCFARSSPSAQAWIYRQPKVGPVVEEFVEHGRLSRKSKVAASIGMSLAASVCAWALWEKPAILAAAIGLILIGGAYVWTRAAA